MSEQELENEIELEAKCIKNRRKHLAQAWKETEYGIKGQEEEK